MIDQDYVCGDYGTETEWTQVKVTVKLERLDDLVAIMSMVSNNLQIEDYSDIDLKTCYGDLIDESILNADKTIASVSVYLPAERSVAECIAFLKERFADADLADAKLELVGVNEEDWANSWKAYYKPIKIGERLVIVPAWEKYTPAEGELILKVAEELKGSVPCTGCRYWKTSETISGKPSKNAAGFFRISSGNSLYGPASLPVSSNLPLP